MLKYEVRLLSNLKFSVEDNKPNQNVEFFFHWLLVYCTFHFLLRKVPSSHVFLVRIFIESNILISVDMSRNSHLNVLKANAY